MPQAEGVTAAIPQDFPQVQNFELSCNLALIVRKRAGVVIAMEQCDLPPEGVRGGVVT